MKKILILTSQGGGGHTATTKALTDHLQHNYNVISANIFKDILFPLDLLQSISGGRWNGDKFYNWCIEKKYFRILNRLQKFIERQCIKQRHKTEPLFLQYFKDHKPDAIISVFPLFNGTILAAAQELNIPFMLVPTDLATHTFLHDIKAPTYVKFRFTLSFDDNEIQKIANVARIPAEKTTITGFPVRDDFFEEKNKTTIKTAFDIAENKPVILLLMGFVGSSGLYTYAKELAKLSHPAHIVICIGKYEGIRKKLAKIDLPPHVTFTIVGFTDKISDLLSVSDLFITKSGSVSFIEGIYSETPMLLDATSGVLTWEKFNHHFIHKYDFGDVIEQRTQIVPKVDALLGDTSKLAHYKRNLKSFEKKHGCKEVELLLQKMLAL